MEEEPRVPTIHLPGGGTRAKCIGPCGRWGVWPATRGSCRRCYEKMEVKAREEVKLNIENTMPDPKVWDRIMTEEEIWIAKNRFPAIGPPKWE